jgi:hypothetical protein
MLFVTHLHDDRGRAAMPRFASLEVAARQAKHAADWGICMTARIISAGGPNI